MNMELPSETEAAARVTHPQFQAPLEPPPAKDAIAHVDLTQQEGDGNLLRQLQKVKLVTPSLPLLLKSTVKRLECLF